MNDMEKIITHLQIINTWAEFARERDLQFFTAKHLDHIVQWTDDAITLLEEQEPLEPIYNEEKYGDHLPHCGNCEKVLPNNAVYGKVNFCHYCGRSVKWND